MSEERVVLIAKRLGAVQELKHQVRGFGLLEGPIDTRTLGRVVRLSQSRGIDQLDRPAIERRQGGYQISRRARSGIDNRPLVTDQGVEQAALPHVGPSGDHHPPARGETHSDVPARDESVKMLERQVTRPTDFLDQSRELEVERPWVCSSKISAVRNVDARVRSSSAAALIGDSPVRSAQTAGSASWAPASLSASTTRPTAADPPWH